MVDKINLSDVLTTISKLSYDLYDLILTANIQAVPVMDLISGIYNKANLHTNDVAICNMQVDAACKKGQSYTQMYSLTLLVPAPSWDELPLCYVVDFIVDINTSKIIHLCISFDEFNNNFTDDKLVFNCDDIQGFKLPNNFSLDLNINDTYIAVNCDKLDIED